MLTLEKFEEASEVVKQVTTPTKLVYSEYLSAQTGARIYLKPENMQHTGAYKLRGAYYKISTLSEEDRSKGLITASAGNHAQGVAYAAKRYGCRATIVMPIGTPLIKVNRTKSYGAEVILYGDVYDDACEYAYKLAEEHGYTFVHPFDDLDVATGQGSIQVIGVEPREAASMTAALKAGEVVELPSANTIADGTAVKTVGKQNLPYVQKYVDQILLVDDDELVGAFLDMVENHKMIVENSGLLSVAALKQLDLKGKKAVCVLSGGNMDVITMSSIVQHGLIQRDRIFSVAVLLPDKTGELVRVASIIANEKGNVIKLEHNQFVSTNRNAAVELRITMEAFGTEHKQKILNALKEAGYEPKKVGAKLY